MKKKILIAAMATAVFIACAPAAPPSQDQDLPNNARPSAADDKPTPTVEPENDPIIDGRLQTKLDRHLAKKAEAATRSATVETTIPLHHRSR